MNSLRCLIHLCSLVFLKHLCIPSFSCSQTFSGSLLPFSNCVSYSFQFVPPTLAGPGASLCPRCHMLPGCLFLVSPFSPNLHPRPFSIPPTLVSAALTVPLILGSPSISGPCSVIEYALWLNALLILTSLVLLSLN